MNTTTMDLNNVSFFKPVAGKTLREQLQGKTLVGADVVEYLRSDPKDFVPPAHWEKPEGDEMSSRNVPTKRIYGFSLTHLAPRHEKGESVVNGFVWTTERFGRHFRYLDGDILDVIVGDEGWDENDWILVQE